MKTTASNTTLITALNNVNQKHGYKLEFDRFEKQGKYYFFTIKTKSGIPGARVSPSGRNLAKASWHAHGYIFDEIFNIEPEAIIYSAGNKITKDQGNWVDVNIGSVAYPCYYSQVSIL